MKKFRITVEGKQYEVDVELIEDTDDDGLLPSYYNPAPVRNTLHSSELIEPQIVAPYKPKSTVAKSSDSKILNSPLNGVVLEILVKPGQKVKTDDVLIIIEAMKMKTNISSPMDGVIDSIEVIVTDRVEIGQLLVRYK
jgi:biotin carboxyl carrier protein